MGILILKQRIHRTGKSTGMEADELLRRYAAGERDFRKVDLSSANLTKANLSGINLSGANLSGTKKLLLGCPRCDRLFEMDHPLIPCVCSRCGWFRKWF